jgi:Chaperone of endosialidase
MKGNMKNTFVQILLGVFVATAAHADTSLTVGSVSPGAGGPCWDDTLVVPNPPSATGTFTLPGVSGSGTVSSIVSYVADNVHGQQHLRYNYSVDMSGMSAAANHCVKLLIHFGTPHTCAYDVLVVTGPGVPVTSATKAVFGDVTFTFASGCLSPPQTSSSFEMLSDTQPKTNVVTVIDDYTDPAGGQTNEARVNVTAVVPDIPPDWAYAPAPIPNPFYQCILYTNAVPMLTNTNKFAVTGPYDFALQLYDAPSNGLAIGPVITQTVQVVNGLFNIPLPFEPASINWGDRWLDIGVRPSFTGGVFVGIGRQAITPTPQALYAYSAGVVADISPDQAVTSVNGITGNLTLQGGSGIQVTLNGSGKIITISQIGSPSDRNLKTDFTAVKPGEILARLTRLPISSWRYTNEMAGVRHVGPMAQDFKSIFNLGSDSRMIGFVDEQGVALAAIQGLNQKVESDNAALRAENAELKARLDKLEQLINSKQGGAR